MANSKKRTTMAKFARENAVRERRMIKQSKKDARKLAAATGQAEAAHTAEQPAGQEQR